MAKISRDELKEKFENGQFPTEADFVDLIDSMVNQKEDKVKVGSNQELGIGFDTDDNTDTPQAQLHVKGPIYIEEEDTLTELNPEATLLYHNTTKQGVPNPEGQAKGLFGDGFRIIHKAKTLDTDGDINNHDYLVIEKTDGNQNIVDGGILFRSRNQDDKVIHNMVIQGDGKVGICKLDPKAALDVKGDAIKTGGGNWGSPSDERLKKNIKPFEEGLAKLREVKPIKFKYNGKGDTPNDGQDYIGVKAQEIQSVFPYMVKTRRAKLNPKDKKDTELLEFDSSPLIFVVINAIKELDERLTSLEKSVASASPKKAASSPKADPKKSQS